jgi:hypothetical protein
VLEEAEAVARGAGLEKISITNQTGPLIATEVVVVEVEVVVVAEVVVVVAVAVAVEEVTEVVVEDEVDAAVDIMRLGTSE